MTMIIVDIIFIIAVTVIDSNGNNILTVIL